MSKAKSVRSLRPIYVVVVFWGVAHRNSFATMLLPSLLAPGNLPAIKDVAGSKLVLCTTEEDWNALQGLPLFAELKKLVDPLHIVIESPASSVNKYLHNSFGFKLAIERCRRDRAFASLLSPDVVLSDRTLAYLREVAERGFEAILAPAMRFEMEKCLSALRKNGLLLPDRPIVASGARLAAIAETGLHSEIRRFEWQASHFCRQPISVWWRLRDNNGILMHTTSWAMALVNFDALAEVQDKSLDVTTLDGVFILENFFKFNDSGRLHLVTDSDDMFLLPLTDESEMSFYPLRPLLLNQLPVLGRLIKLWNLQTFLAGPTFDPFRRWAITVPTFIHGIPLSDRDRKQAAVTSELMRDATTPPGRLLRFYAALPPWALVRSLLSLLFHQPRRFCVKLWGRALGRRTASAAPLVDENRRT